MLSPSTPSSSEVVAVADFLRPAEALGLFGRRESGSRIEPDPLMLAEVGCDALAALRACALAPATSPF